MITTAATTTPHAALPPKPRKKRPPSERNQQIYRDYAVLGRSQAELASQYKVSQVRISQIIGLVETWARRRYPGHDGEPTQDDRQRLERQLEIDRQTLLFRQAIKAMEQGTMTTKTITKTLNADGTVKSIVETIREVPIFMQAQRQAQRAAEQLAKLNDKPPPPLPDPARDLDRREATLLQILCQMRCEAEEAGLVKESRDLFYLVSAWKNALLGDLNSFPGMYRDYKEDALDEILAYYAKPTPPAPATHEGGYARGWLGVHGRNPGRG
jgi:ribosomal protein S30